MWNVKWNFLAKILIFLASTAAVEAVQRFVEMPTYTEVNPGEDALLKCRISDKRGVCSWQKDNKPVGIYRGKYEWANEDSPAGGDCSLWVRAATLQLDDGQWQCQVTASNYDVQDALSSPPAALAVRVPPQTPRILFNGSLVMAGQNITVPAGARATVVCEARFGNPPAYIEWFLEKERLAAWSQTNASEAERPRVWAARSVLELGATRSAHGRQLSCRAHHPSYPAPRFKESYTMLDVTFVPVVSIVGADPSNLANLEESASALALECKADGNPSPYIWWTKDGQVISTNGPKLYLAPVHRNHSGIYGCQARNTLGTSDSVKVEIDIKYPPKVMWVGPDTIVETNLFSQVTLECRAEGNPHPSYQWYHNPTPGAHINAPDGYPVSGTPQLQLLNVSYAQHGHYACVATNVIGAQERSHQSEPITLNVLGPPVGAETGTAHAWSGAEGKVSATVCADPPPRRAAWLWGSLRLEVPSQIGRYRSLEPTGVNGCYRYTLLISSTSASDARVYVLHVENERGFSSHAVSLTVHEWHFSLTEGAHVAPLIAAALAAAALLVLLVCLLLRCRRRRESVEYKTDDLDSEKTVLPADAVYAPPRSGSVLGVSSTGPRPGPAGGPPPGGPGGAGGAGGARYSPGALQAALTSLEREAKENVYAVLDPHIQYEITINKHGEPPKYLSLSKPLSHQRAQAFDTQNFTEINNNNDLNENRFTTFKSGPPKARRSNRSTDKKEKNDKSIICKSNNDIEYTQNPYFGIYGVESTADLHTQRMNEQKSMKNYSRMYERHNSGRKNNVRNNIDNEIDNFKADVKRSSNRSRREEKNNVKSFPREMEKERSFEEYNAEAIEKRGADEYLPRPGKVREIASKFNRNSSSGHSKKKERPKPLQGYGNQYLDHVFPDAVEV